MRVSEGVSMRVLLAFHRVLDFCHHFCRISMFFNDFLKMMSTVLTFF